MKFGLISLGAIVTQLGYKIQWMFVTGATPNICTQFQRGKVEDGRKEKNEKRISHSKYNIRNSKLSTSELKSERNREKKSTHIHTSNTVRYATLAKQRRKRLKCVACTMCVHLQ